MKTSKVFLSAIALSFIFLVSCQREIEVEIQRISFENVMLNSNGYQNYFPDGLILSDVDFSNYFENSSYTFWSGFSVSNNTDKTTEGMDNQYSVYGNGGVGGSEKFAIVYDGWYDGATFEKPFCKFPAGQEFKFKGLWINNATYVVLDVKNGSAFTKKFTDGDWFKIIITGYNSAGNKTAAVEFYLADFRNGKNFICSDWTFVNLSVLGKVNKLGFAFDSSDKGAYGVNTPQYACIDDVIYYVE